jgi:hypothetical protein
MENKTHYRKVFKSDHLSSFDLEDFIENGVNLEFTIKNVKQFELTNDKNSGVRVAGKVIGANIAYFVEDIKPMVLNATNSGTVAKLTKSSFVDDWKNIPVELYILKNIKFGKETVTGIRIKEEAPKSITDQEIKLIKGKVAACLSNVELNAFYASLTSKEKTNKEVLQILKDKQLDLKQQ